MSPKAYGLANLFVIAIFGILALDLPSAVSGSVSDSGFGALPGGQGMLTALFGLAGSVFAMLGATVVLSMATARRLNGAKLSYGWMGLYIPLLVATLSYFCLYSMSGNFAFKLGVMTMPNFPMTTIGLLGFVGFLSVYEGQRGGLLRLSARTPFIPGYAAIASGVGLTAVALQLMFANMSAIPIFRLRFTQWGQSYDWIMGRTLEMLNAITSGQFALIASALFIASLIGVWVRDNAEGSTSAVADAAVTPRTIRPQKATPQTRLFD